MPALSCCSRFHSRRSGPGWPRKNLEPSTPVKFGLGILQAGLGFGALVFGAQFPNEAGQVAMIWLILAYLLHTTGELCLSPVGLSAVTKLSIGNVVGVSMGTWFLATALSETVATRIGKMAAIDTRRAHRRRPTRWRPTRSSSNS